MSILATSAANSIDAPPPSAETVAAEPAPVGVNFTFDPASAEAAGDTRLALLSEQPANQAGQPPHTDSITSAAPAAQFGEEGTRRWTVIGTYATDLDNNTIGMVSVGLSFFIMDNLSLDGAIEGLYTDQNGPNAGGGGFSLLFRWHLLHNDSNSWTAYFEGGAGMMFSSNDIPAGGTSYNFTPRIGGGMSFDVGNDTRLMVGMGWLHISNANTSRNNPGQDNLQLYIGLSFPY